MFHTIKTGSLEYLTADSLSGSAHCFSTRFGGVSETILPRSTSARTGATCRKNVRENYRILGAAVGFAPEQTVFTKQEHTDTILRVGRADCGTGLSREQTVVCDGLITDDSGVALCCFGADCTTILLFDPVTGALGAVHSGWRGTAMGIAAKAVAAMCREFGCDPAGIRAAIGPCIGLCCFEVGPEVPEAMRNALGAGAEPFSSRAVKNITSTSRVSTASGSSGPAFPRSTSARTAPVPARPLLVAPRRGKPARLSGGHHREKR